MPPNSNWILHVEGSGPTNGDKNAGDKITQEFLEMIEGRGHEVKSVSYATVNGNIRDLRALAGSGSGSRH